MVTKRGGYRGGARPYFLLAHTDNNLNKMASSDTLLELSGTITTVYPVEHDGRLNQLVQKVILDNCQVTSGITTVPLRLLLIVKVPDADAPIPFKVNHSLTAKGLFKRMPSDFLSYLHTVHAPSGYLRYDGKIYR